MQLLSYGAGVKVKKPASLKKEIKEELKKAIDQY
jgi:predicted DNA-binding transcriptional regulator YafY